MANSVMERIMEQRHSLGLPAKAIQWGAVGEVGLVADMQEDLLDMEIGGTLQQRISSCLEEMDPLMTVDEPLVSSMVVAEKRYSSIGKGNIVDTVVNIMGIRDLKSISLETTLTELGMDSLMAVELKQIFEREFDIVLSTQELRTLTLMKVMEFAKQAEGDAKSALTGSADDDSSLIENLITVLGDEAQSNETILRLNNDKLNPNSNCLGLLIPGIEGIGSNAHRNIVENLNFPTSILQLKKTSLATTLDETFKIIEEVRTSIHPSSVH
jgi:fatty acid synthase